MSNTVTNILGKPAQIGPQWADKFEPVRRNVSSLPLELIQEGLARTALRGGVEMATLRAMLAVYGELAFGRKFPVMRWIHDVAKEDDSVSLTVGFGQENELVAVNFSKTINSEELFRGVARYIPVAFGTNALNHLRQPWNPNLAWSVTEPTKFYQGPQLIASDILQDCHIATGFEGSKRVLSIQHTSQPLPIVNEG